MTPDTLHLVQQELRHLKSFATVQESWAQKQPRTPTRDEIFRRVNFWRYIWHLTELIIGEYASWQQDGDARDQRHRFWTTVAAVAQRQLATK